MSTNTRLVLIVSMWLLAGGLCVPLPVYAQATDTTAADAGGQSAVQDDGMEQLADLLRMAATNNNELKAAHAAWQAAQLQAPQVSTLPDPMLKFAYYIEPIETRTGPQRMRYGLSQTFPLAGKLGAKAEVANKQAEVARARVDLLKLRLYRDVKTTWYEYGYLGRAIAIVHENLELLRFIEEVARVRYSAGSTLYADVLQVQMAVDKTRDRLASLEQLAAPLASKLNARLSRDLQTAVPMVHTLPMMQMEQSVEELRKVLVANNPQLLIVRAQEQVGEAAQNLAETKYYPDLTIGVDSIWTDPSRGSNITNDGHDPIIASIAVNLPIWQSGRDAALEQARTNIRKARITRASLEETLLADLELAAYKYEDARRKYALYRDMLIPRADQSVEVLLEGYQTGTVSFVDMLLAEQTRFELQLAQARVLTDQAIRLAQMEFLVGSEIPCIFHGSVQGNGTAQ